MTWRQMKKRCLNPKCKAYPNYGGRGIAVCDRWMVFENFLEDMGHPPEGMTLERIDNDGNYCPENCKWATMQEQAYNKRPHKKITINGKKRTVSYWARMFNTTRENIELCGRKLGWI